MSEVIVVGTDPDRLADALEAADLEVARVAADAGGADLEAAGGSAAAVLLLTGAGQASLVPVARDLNDRIAIVLYADEGFPDFASAQADLAVDRTLVDRDAIVDAIVDRVHTSA